MTKFKHEDDPGFTSIALALQRMVNEAQGTQGM